MRIVVATKNPHKVQEFRRLLADIPDLELVPYDGPAPAETGVTFRENAAIKAYAAAQATGELALADDSGIAVDVMGGAPGIFSARWAGVRQSDSANRELLLEQLADVPEGHRGASFVCALVVAAPEDGPHESGATVVAEAEARWAGSIARAEAGANGFGYDPVFVPAGHTRTAAELDPVEKDAQSHRARAAAKLVPILRAALARD